MTPASPFGYLHRETQRYFGSDTGKLWWAVSEAAARAGQYTVGIAFAAAPLRKDERPVMGSLTVPVDGLVIHVSADAFPDGFPPRAEITCLVGPADDTGLAPAATCKRYKVGNASHSADYHTHWRLSLERQ
jgi:hypothetical protein